MTSSRSASQLFTRACRSVFFAFAAYEPLRARQTELNLAIASDRAHMIDATEVDAALSEGLVPRKFSAVANHVNRLVRAANGLGR